MKKSCHIKLVPNGLVVCVESGTTVLDALAPFSLLRADCGGKGLCGKCRVQALPADHLTPITDIERQHLSPQMHTASHRLACQAGITGDITLQVAAAWKAGRAARGKTGLTGPFHVFPGVHRIMVPSQPNLSPDRWIETVKAVAQSDVPWRQPPTALLSDRQWTATIDEHRSQSDWLTLVIHHRHGLVNVLAGRHPDGMGLAVDIGTTTIAAYLCDLSSGKVIAAAAMVNPQRRYGEDVISRIAMADSRPDGRRLLHDAVVQAVNYLINDCLAQAGLKKNDIDDVVAVGNTTMHHLFAGLDPGSLGQAPYHPATTKALEIKAEQLGLDLMPQVMVHLMPVIAGFVGADTLAVALAEQTGSREEISLLIDVGTNGEVVVGNNGSMWATSCATGPALEGAQISCGMRADNGAIYAVAQDGPDGSNFHIRYFGEENDGGPVGICGSGILDAVAAMCRAGIVSPDGRLQMGHPEVVTDDGGQRRFVLVPGNSNPAGVEIAVTQKDIRQVQLAKAALRTGIDLLLQHAGITRVDRTVLTGAFGVGFDHRNAVRIGLLPEADIAGKVGAAVNLAGQGAVMALLDYRLRETARQWAGRIEHINLASVPGFTERFSAATRF